MSSWTVAHASLRSRCDNGTVLSRGIAAVCSSSSSSHSSGGTGISRSGKKGVAAAGHTGGDVIDVESTEVEPSVGSDEPDTALAPRRGTELAPRREGYHVVSLETCEFLFAAGADGTLDMTDVYVFDKETEVYARPDFRGDMPSDPSLYQIIPWKEEYLGDSLNDKEPKVWIKKAFLVRVAVGGPGPTDYRLDLDTLLQIDDEGRTLSRCEVERPPGVPRSDREVLRIRDGRFTVVPDEAVPTPDEVIEAAQEGRDAPNRLPGLAHDVEATSSSASASAAGAAIPVAGSPTDSYSSATDGDVSEGEPDPEELADLEDDLDNLDIPPIDLA